MLEQAVRSWEEMRDIPTYGVGQPDKNPMFLEKRVYQGSSGKVYPHPVIDKIQDEKQDQPYHLICLENEYLHIEIMPERGGRVYRALDKTNGYDFVYYNRVIKPALVGLAGPWLSGGIEFNWPQHHRPNTFGPVEYTITEQADGSRTAWVSEIDRMYGTKMLTGFTLHPGKAYLELQVQLYNRTTLPQSFLWWANPAVAVNQHTQSIFPPDVHAVFDHGKRDSSRFPIATGTYYKMDYSAGVDISWYKNIPVPTSYMVHHSDYDFIGGYDHGLQAGMLHVANHHISPGKKQWTWGNGAFGQAWDRNLTDEDGPYIELMVGVYTDNQPDFSWLQPYEEKSFKQYFMPYKQIGMVKNASLDAAVNLEVDAEHHLAHVQVYTTALFPDAMIELKGLQQTYLSQQTTLSPTQLFSTELALAPEELAHHLRVTVKDAQGKLLVAYQPEEPGINIVPEAAKPLPDPEAMSNTEALYLAGLHLEQYRHATYEPDAYYQEGLKRDPGDIRINVAYGRLLLRRGLFQESEQLFRTAIATLTRHNPNPYDGEAYYQLGQALQWQGRSEEAKAAFYKATWSAAWQDIGYFALAQLAASQKSYREALELVEKALIRNSHQYKARHLKTVLLRKLGRLEDALHYAAETLQLDITDFGAYHERYLLFTQNGATGEAQEAADMLQLLLRGDEHNYLALALDYRHSGFYEESVAIIEESMRESAGPMTCYYLAYLSKLMGADAQAQHYREAARKASPDYCFPNSLDDLVVLKDAIVLDPYDGRAHYYLGNLLYDKKRATDAIVHWEASRAADATFATVHRNLSLAYYNVLQQSEQAVVALEQAFACDPTDARVFYELDQLYKRVGEVPRQRLARLEQHQELVAARDDLHLEYITLLNTLHQHEKAIQLLEARLFHPWEGGEGKATGQYVFAHLEAGKQKLLEQQPQEAIAHFQQALIYPDNLGEGKLTGAQENNIYYYLGSAYAALNQPEQATDALRRASKGLQEPTSAMFYNDQPPDMIFYQGLAWLKLQDEKQAKSRFHKLVDYGEQHLFDVVKIDYFAVSLPDFLVFEDDLQKRNQVHCHYMMGLGYLGLRQYEQARTHFQQALQLDCSHQGAQIHLAMCEQPAF